MALPNLSWLFSAGANDGDRGLWWLVQSPDESGPQAVNRADQGLDAEVVRQIRDGDMAAFERVFRQLYPALVGFAGSLLGGMVGERDAAEDVVQGVLWDTWEHRATLDPARSIRAYLFAAVRNRALNARRDAGLAAQRGREAASEALVNQTQQAPASEEESLLERARRAIATLPERDREVLLLRMQGLTFAEIEAILHLPLKTVATRARRAIERLRQQVLGADA